MSSTDPVVNLLPAGAQYDKRQPGGSEQNNADGDHQLSSEITELMSGFRLDQFVQVVSFACCYPLTLYILYPLQLHWVQLSAIK